jgi:hypothetical protein
MRAYLLIILPAAIVGVGYFVIFHSLGLEMTPAPFLGALAAFAVALFLVRRYSNRKARRPGRS